MKQQGGETFDWAAVLASDEGRVYAHAAEQFLDDAANAPGVGATEQALIGIGYALLAVGAHLEASRPSGEDLDDAPAPRRPWWRRLIGRSVRPVDQVDQDHGAETTAEAGETVAEVIEGPWGRS